MGVRGLAVANGPNIFRMLLVIIRIDIITVKFYISDYAYMACFILPAVRAKQYSASNVCYVEKVRL